jgi:translation initiation factor 2 beta subunit (eIF-2beta)/eIF-5
METYFDFIHDSERYDLEFDTKQEVKTWADEWWMERCINDDCPRDNGEVIEDIGYIVEFYFNEIGERVDIDSEEFILSYEFYRGDYAEHFYQGDYV